MMNLRAVSRNLKQKRRARLQRQVQRQRQRGSKTPLIRRMMLMPCLQSNLLMMYPVSHCWAGIISDLQWKQQSNGKQGGYGSSVVRINGLTKRFTSERKKVCSCCHPLCMTSWPSLGDYVQWFHAKADMQQWQEQWELHQAEFDCLLLALYYMKSV